MQIQVWMRWIRSVHFTTPLFLKRTESLDFHIKYIDISFTLYTNGMWQWIITANLKWKTEQNKAKQKQFEMFDALWLIKYALTHVNNFL